VLRKYEPACLFCANTNNMELIAKNSACPGHLSRMLQPAHVSYLHDCLQTYFPLAEVLILSAFPHMLIFELPGKKGEKICYWILDQSVFSSLKIKGKPTSNYPYYSIKKSDLYIRARPVFDKVHFPDIIYKNENLNTHYHFGRHNGKRKRT